jgi:hypothetical protein
MNGHTRRTTRSQVRRPPLPCGCTTRFAVLCTPGREFETDNRLGSRRGCLVLCSYGNYRVVYAARVGRSRFKASSGDFGQSHYAGNRSSILVSIRSAVVSAPQSLTRQRS